MNVLGILVAVVIVALLGWLAIATIRHYWMRSNQLFRFLGWRRSGVRVRRDGLKQAEQRMYDEENP